MLAYEYSEPNFDRKRFLDNLGVLSKINSPSNNEGEMRNHLIQIIEELGLNFEIDKRGNLLVPSDHPEGEILLCAHMDKVGQGVELEKDANYAIGRLDDAIGLGIIIEILRRGRRPSVLFTVAEENEKEEIVDEKVVVKKRDLLKGEYDAGSGYASEQMFVEKSDDKAYEKMKKPKLVVIIDVDGEEKIGDGPLIYQSETAKGTKGAFGFPSSGLTDVARIINFQKIGVKYVHGLGGNDAIDFTFVPRVGVIAIEIPVNNLHSDKETASILDIQKAVKITEEIIKNHEKIRMVEKEMPHAIKGKPIEL